MNQTFLSTNSYFDPFAKDDSFSYSPNASNIYALNNLTYISSIDPIKDLYARYCYDQGCAANGKLTICFLMHGYSADASAITDNDLRAFAKYGLFAVAVGMRGRNGADGHRDSDGRENYDILDALFTIQNDPILSQIVSQGQAVMVGYSGGGGNALSCAIKFPAYFKVMVANFPLSDKGYRTDTGWWYTYGPSQSLLFTDVGDRIKSSDPYLCRDIISALPNILSLRGCGLFVELLHAVNDSIISVEQSRQIKNLLSDCGIDNFRYQEFQPGEFIHGHRNDSVLISNKERSYSRRLRETPDWKMPVCGKIRVNGYFRVPAFEIWLGPDPNPKFASSGGLAQVADVEFNSITGIFKISPITKDPMFVWIKLGNIIKEISISCDSIIEIYSV